MSRVAIALIATLLGAFAVPVVGAANAISADPICRDIDRGKVEGSLDDCFNGSTARRAVVVGLLYACGLAAGVALVVGAAAALFGSRGVALALAVVLTALLFLAAYGAARF